MNSGETEIVILHPSEQMLEVSYALHNQFNEEVWNAGKPERASFHNAEHIRAVAQGSDKLIDAAQFGNDPLNLQKDLDRWNEAHPDAVVSNLQELKKVFRIAYSAHDFGNTSESVKNVDGRLEPQYLDKYTAKDAENRTIAMLPTILEAESDLTDDERTRFLPLVTDIVERTRFGYPTTDQLGEEPFAKAVRVMDQIGNDLLTTNQRVVEGLLEEIVSERPDATFNPTLFYNFARKRLPQLLFPESFKLGQPQPEVTAEQSELMASICRIWGKDGLPPVVSGVEDREISVRDYLDSLHAKAA